MDDRTPEGTPFPPAPLPLPPEPCPDRWPPAIPPLPQPPAPPEPPDLQAAPTFEREAATMDGVPYHLRPIAPADADGLRAFHRGLSDRTTYLRFFCCHPVLSTAEVERFTQVDHLDRLALVAEREGKLIGVGRFDRIEGSLAEVAFVVADAFQRRGVGTCLLDELVLAARAVGITTLTAEVLTENGAMLDVFCHSGLPADIVHDGDVASVRLAIGPTEGYTTALASRQATRAIVPGAVPRSALVEGSPRQRRP